MTKFFFNIRDGDRYYPDEEGTNLPNMEAARAEATVSAREIAADMILEGKYPDHHQFEIVPEGEKTAEIISFRNAMRLIKTA